MENNLLSKIITLLIHLRRDLKEIPEILSFAKKTSSSYKNSFILNIFRSLWLKYKHNFSPKEYFYHGYLDPKNFKDKKKEFISRKKLSEMQLKVNPAGYKLLTEDKSYFHKFCKSANLPVPVFYGVYLRQFYGTDESGKILKGEKKWQEYFSEKVNGGFVIKPSKGVYGKSISTFTNTNGVLKDINGNTISAGNILDLMNSDGKYNSFIIEKRLVACKELSEMLGSDNLHTLRLITFANSADDAEVLSAELKIINGNNFAANIDFGSTGNLISQVDLNSGVLVNLIMCNRESGQNIFLDKIPATGLDITEVSIPQFNEAKKMALNAAKIFLPIRFIGWDIAVTDDGVFLLEGNMYFDFPTSEDEYRKIRKKFTEILTRL